MAARGQARGQARSSWGRRLASMVLLGCALSTAMGAAAAAMADGLPRPLLIAHRGASAYLPEHTLAAYELALDQGADCIESDIVPTRDGQLIVRHDNRLDLTTDVADRPEFADRRRAVPVQGESPGGWFAEDFTLAEVRTLRARERLPALRPGSARSDGRLPVPSLDDVLRFIREQEVIRGRPICFLPEIKHPHYFAQRGLPLESALVAALRAHGYRDRADPVLIQSFEIAALRKLAVLADFRLLQLFGDGIPADVQAAGGTLSYRQMATPAGLSEVAQYADAIGPAKDFGLTGAGLTPDLESVRGLVAMAHAHGLQVYPYTFRAENCFVLPAFRRGAGCDGVGDLAGELLFYWTAGVDGVFVDNPDIGVAARQQWLRCRPQCAQRVPASPVAQPVPALP